MSLATRVGRGMLLTGRWIRYLATAADGPVVALRDFRGWIATTLLGRDLTTDDLPWLTFPAIRWLKAHCRPGWRVFEWGSGSSTSFFLSRGCQIVSVEHDPEWHARVMARVGGATALDLRLVEPTAGGSMEDGRDGSSRGSFAAYVAAVDDQPDGGLDLVVVDGRARLDCLARARAKVATGGAMLLDDSGRDMYRSGLALFREPEWETLHLPGPQPGSIWPAFSRTTLFLRRHER